jgi:hypothetical protein
MAEQHKDPSLGDHRTRAAAHLTVTVDTGRQLHVPTSVYTKVEIDNKLTTLVTGLEHGVSVIDRTNNPPTTPVDDEFYIVGIAPLGAWVGKNNQLAYWNGTAWQFTPPQANEAHLVESESATYTYNATTANWVKVANASTSAASGDLWQVGSVQQSLLTESQWATALGVEATKWVLADGRDVSGSRWATLTGQTRVPDMRGGFLRAAGQNTNASTNWNGGAVGSFHDDTTRIPRNTAFTGTTNTTGSHYHASGVPGYDDSRGYIYGRLPITAGVPQASNYFGTAQITPLTSTDGDHTHTVTVAGGDVETAPSHFSLNTFIKIN